MHGGGRPLHSEGRVASILLFSDSQGPKEALLDLGLMGVFNFSLSTSTQLIFTYRAYSGTRDVLASAVEFCAIARPCDKAQERVLIDNVVPHSTRRYFLMQKELNGSQQMGEDATMGNLLTFHILMVDCCVLIPPWAAVALRTLLHRDTCLRLKFVEVI